MRRRDGVDHPSGRDVGDGSAELVTDLSPSAFAFVLRTPLRPLMPDPARQRAERLDARIDRLEDSINHFYKVINELRERLSTMEKKLNALARKDN